ncbi:Leukocyte receptor cluster (LRC) member 8 [Perkinsus chesapeaki]|uniref:Leukocyte receptor cluster (LRC) member 8 n=1 Tax=Perkinsus chesapeaki TaxID=330153 RepID=A0A7J6M730_PERCH|nr:Leukocyte receptor cluster (LRC) member 8 [Perkinsus chesapeaki]
MFESDVKVVVFADEGLRVARARNVQPEQVCSIALKLLVLMDEAGGLQLLGVVLAELFRYSIIYLNGGVYFDIDTRCKESIEELLRPSDDLVFSLGNMPNQQVSQWGFAASPRNQILGDLFEVAIEKILSHDESKGIPKRIDEFVSMELMDRMVKEALGVTTLQADKEYKTRNEASVRVLPQDRGEHWNGRVDFKYGGYEKDLKKCGLRHWHYGWGR